MLSILDHNKDAREDVKYLVQSYGPGKSWVFGMATPPQLAGVSNPWNGKQMAKEIKKGLGARHLPDARTRCDIALGDSRSAPPPPHFRSSTARPPQHS